MPKNVLHQNPRDASFVANPYALYTKLHSQGHAVFWQDYGFWCLYNFDLVNKVLRDRRFARVPPPDSEPIATQDHMHDFARTEAYSLLALEPPEHTRLRKRVNHAFLSKQITLMVDDIRQLAHRCIDQFEGLGSVEILTHYATPIPVSVITKLLGVPEADGRKLTAWSHAMVRVYTLTQTLAEENAANLAAREFQQYLSAAIHRKRSSPEDDLLSRMIEPSDREPALEEDEIISIAILLLNAGHEATVHQIGNATYTLLRHYPYDRRGKLLDTLQDDAQADALVDELFRYAAPLHLFTRFAQQDIAIDDALTVRKGEQIGLLLAAANRCPAKFSNAENFDPERHDAAHLSLGAGIHFCVGAQLAKLELRIALQVLFERLPGLRLSEQPEYQDSYHFHGLKALHTSW